MSDVSIKVKGLFFPRVVISLEPESIKKITKTNEFSLRFKKHRLYFTEEKDSGGKEKTKYLIRWARRHKGKYTLHYDDEAKLYYINL